MATIIKKRYSIRKDLRQPFSFEICKDKSGRFQHSLKSGFFVDICSEGAKIITNNSLIKGEVLKLYYPISEMNDTIPVFAEVMWCKEEEQSFSVGLRFMELNLSQLR